MPVLHLFKLPASLALNAVLAITVGACLRLPPAGNSLPPSPAYKAADISTPVPVDQHSSLSIEPSRRFDYGTIKSPTERRRAIIDALRAMGVPNEILGRVAKVDLEVQWDSRFQACWGDMDKMAAIQLELNRTRDTELEAALGPVDFKVWDQKNQLWEAMSTSVAVSPSEAESIYTAKKRLQQKQLEIETARLNHTLDDTGINAAYDQAYAEFYHQMQAVLGPERYAQSQQLDDAFAADNLRHQLAGINPSETQFQSLQQAEQALKNARLELDHEFQNDPNSPDYLAKLKVLESTRDSTYQSVLGADAFDTLRKQADPGYNQMEKYAQLWGLDTGKIDFTYNTIRTYEQKVQTYQAQVSQLQNTGQPVDWQRVQSTLQNLADQAQSDLLNRLGADTWQRLQRNHIVRFTLVQTPP